MKYCMMPSSILYVLYVWKEKDYREANDGNENCKKKYIYY
jgi:hypothetical protein